MRTWCAVVFLAVMPAAAQPTPTFSSSVETVYVDAFVTRGDTPVTGLRAADFEVRDDGVLQDARLADVGHMPVTATLALDVSGSVQGERLKQLRLAGHAFVSHLAPDDRVGLLVFSNQLRLAVPHTSDRAVVQQGLDSFQPGGETALFDALYAGLLLPAGPGRSLLVAFTDGEDTISWGDGKQVLDVAEATNTLVHVVGMWPEAVVVRGNRTGPSAYEETLRRIATATGGRTWSAQRPDELSKAFVGILDELRTRYLLAYEPRGTPRPGRHQLDVRVHGGKGKVRARASYFVSQQP